MRFAASSAQRRLCSSGLTCSRLEWAALAKQALREWVGDANALARVVEHWLAERRQQAVKIDWQFRIIDAEIKLKRLYPTFTV